MSLGFFYLFCQELCGSVFNIGVFILLLYQCVYSRTRESSCTEYNGSVRLSKKPVLAGRYFLRLLCGTNNLCIYGLFFGIALRVCFRLYKIHRSSLHCLAGVSHINQQAGRRSHGKSPQPVIGLSPPADQCKNLYVWHHCFDRVCHSFQQQSWCYTRHFISDCDNGDLRYDGLGLFRHNDSGHI